MTSETISIKAKVNRYWVSLTTKEKRGSTKKKSKLATQRTDATAPAIRPSFKAMKTTATRNSITMLERSNTRSSQAAAAVVAAQTRAVTSRVSPRPKGLL
jgi:hypothetical protein